MFIAAYSFKQASNNFDIQENYKRKVFPFEQLFYWLKTELCECDRCSLVKTYSKSSRITPSTVCIYRCPTSSGVL